MNRSSEKSSLIRRIIAGQSDANTPRSQLLLGGLIGLNKPSDGYIVLFLQIFFSFDFFHSKNTEVDRFMFLKVIQGAVWKRNWEEVID